MAALSFSFAFLTVTSFCVFTVSSQYISLGCYRDTSDRAIKSEIAQYYLPTHNSAIRLCNLYAFRLGYKVFGVQAGGECWTSEKASLASANETYAKYGVATKCEDGKGGSYANDVYTVEGLHQYKHVGCFYDKADRAMPRKPADGRLMTFKDKINLCYLDASKSGYTVFSMQYGGQCFSGPDAENTYAKYGLSGACASGTGGVWSNDVYKIYEEYKNLGCFKDSSADRALPTKIGDYNGTGDTDVVRLCYLDAKTRGFKEFGVQDNGTCWSGGKDNSSYNKHGSSSSCSAGMGGPMANDVYSIEATPGPVCPEGWMEDSEMCYKAFAGPKDWEEAKQSCSEQNAALVKIGEQRNQKFLERFVPNGDVTGNALWIGLNAKQVDNLRWLDKENSVAVYFNWNDPYTKVAGAACAVILRSNGRWKMESCSNQHGYICNKAKSSAARVYTSFGIGAQVVFVALYFIIDALQATH